MTPVRSVGDTGFTSQPVAPAALASTFLDSCDSVVSINMGLKRMLAFCLIFLKRVNLTSWEFCRLEDILLKKQKPNLDFVKFQE